MFPFNALALLAWTAYALLATGVFLRQYCKAHMLLMFLGISVDLLLLYLLESRYEGAKMLWDYTFNAPQLVHVVTAGIAYFLYLPVLVLGLLRFFNVGGFEFRGWHIRLGVTAFVCRTLALFSMFSFGGAPYGGASL